jgi:hypothetical protein
MFLLCGAVSLYYQLGFETSAATKTVDVHGGDIYIPELSITMDQAWALKKNWKLVKLALSRPMETRKFGK